MSSQVFKVWAKRLAPYLKEGWSRDMAATKAKLSIHVLTKSGFFRSEEYILLKAEFARGEGDSPIYRPPAVKEGCEYLVRFRDSKDPRAIYECTVLARNKGQAKDRFSFLGPGTDKDVSIISISRIT